MKKKIFISVIFVLICTSAFARFSIKQEFSAAGYIFTKSVDPFTPESNYFKRQWTPLTTNIISTMWEFDSGNTEKLFHFSIGSFAGLFTYRFPIGVSFGFNWKLTEMGPFNLELDTNLKIGPGYNIIYGLYSGMFCMASADVIWIKARTRRGIFWGGGISTDHLFSYSYYEKYGHDFFHEYSISPHILVGFKF